MTTRQRKDSGAKARSGARKLREKPAADQPKVETAPPPVAKAAKPAPKATDRPVTQSPADSAPQNNPQPEGAISATLAENLERIEALTQRLVGALSQRKMPEPALEGPGADFYLQTGQALMKAWATHPARLIETQIKFWGQSLGHYIEAQQALMRGPLKAPDDPGPADPRFKNPLWDSHPFFNAVKRQYQIAVAAIEENLAEILPAVDDPAAARRLRYFTRQIIDMMAPTNFLATNPDALERAVETEGESLVKGLENLVDDIVTNKGELLVTLSDRSAFQVGQNIGATPGSVVYRNELFELIQYAPTTETVHAVPLLIFPPWINKFYIMDLKPQNSLIKWIVDQGFTLFVVSWKNPGPSYAHVKLEDYVAHGYLRAIDTVKTITGQPQVNAVGYCIAGTTLSLTLALLDKTGDTSVKSATFFTTLTDFSDQGEFTTFLQDDFVDGIEAHVKRDGILQGTIMQRTMSFLRANDLVYKPAIRSYMMGEAPPAFDLLFWNGDGTNLPGQMTIDYLRGLCQANAFAEASFPVLGHQVSLSGVRVPLMAIGCETDHIAPARDSFRGVAQMGSDDKTFILSESGHIAGIVNPPGKIKYGHYTSDAPISDFAAWRQAATRHEGSWWPRWRDWIAPRSGDQVAARVPGSVKGFPVLAAAPGTYVVEKDPE
ncbi:class I poly(R)-hydroxyalkanoic acid synthase [Paracoccus sp. p3-h83]|uniref:class I poly(R)-hydroxyalkanoic acid synthase n=1 Tax=Paracoccus sp. p3-h83 TaxID=3342805 RepID=UPI0035BAE565